ncbi:hypothetical protein FOZ63_003151, partial [Perkinsus olseni]
HRKLLARYNDLKASGDLNPNKRALDRVAEKFGIASEESSAPSAKRRKTTKDEKSKKKSSSTKFAKTIGRVADFAVDLAEQLHKDLGLEYKPAGHGKKTKKS